MAFEDLFKGGAAAPGGYARISGYSPHAIPLHMSPECKTPMRVVGLMSACELAERQAANAEHYDRLDRMVKRILRMVGRLPFRPGDGAKGYLLGQYAVVLWAGMETLALYVPSAPAGERFVYERPHRWRQAKAPGRALIAEAVAAARADPRQPHAIRTVEIAPRRNKWARVGRHKSYPFGHSATCAPHPRYHPVISTPPGFRL